MKTILILAILIAAIFFIWRWLIKGEDKPAAGKWTRRVAAALLVGAGSTLALFAIFSTTSWRIW